MCNNTACNTAIWYLILHIILDFKIFFQAFLFSLLLENYKSDLYTGFTHVTNFAVQARLL